MFASILVFPRNQADNDKTYKGIAMRAHTLPHRRTPSTGFTLSAIAAALLSSGSAMATNGYFTHGIGTHNKAQAGSGTASPEQAIDAARERLTQAQGRLEQFHSLVKVSLVLLTCFLKNDIE